MVPQTVDARVAPVAVQKEVGSTVVGCSAEVRFTGGDRISSDINTLGYAVDVFGHVVVRFIYTLEVVRHNLRCDPQDFSSVCTAVVGQ